MKFTLAACVLVFGMISSSDAQQQPRVNGFFSNMRYLKDSGDVLGSEVWIVYGGSYYACVQIAEGTPTPPSCVPVQVSGSKVKFTIRQPLFNPDDTPAPDLVTEFSGSVTKDALRLDNGEILKRRNSYWQ